MAATGARLTANRRRRRAARRSALRGLGWVAGISVIAAALVISLRGTLWRGDEAAIAQGSADRTAPASPPAVAPAPPPPTPVAPSRPAAPEVVEIRVDSTPTGVDVFQGDRMLGTTPFTWRWPKENVDVVLTGEKTGYDYATITINPALNPDRPAVLRLKKAKSGAGKRANRPGRAQDGDGDRAPRADDTAGGDLTGSPYRKAP